MISCNWTDQLLFTYIMALCTSHSHSFVCGWSIVIKFTYLTDINLKINWWKIQQNAWSFSRNSSFLRGLFYYAALVYLVRGDVGPRACAGKEFSMDLLFLMFTSLLQRFEFQKGCDCDLTQCFEGKYNFTFAPMPFKVKLRVHCWPPHLVAGVPAVPCELPPHLVAGVPAVPCELLAAVTTVPSYSSADHSKFY